MIWNKKQVQEYLEKDKEWDLYECTKKRAKSIRSLAMNNYRWAVPCKIVADFMWENEISAHMALKTMFGIETTTNLDNDEFIFLIKSTIALFNEKYNLRIPLPENKSENERLLESLWF